VGYDLDSSRRAVDLAARYGPLYAAVGIHPNYAGRASAADWDQIRLLADQPKVVAIGETGLDNFRDYTPAPLQEAWFERHLALADERGLPVIIHNRQANDRVRTLLRDWSESRRQAGPPGVMHCFAGDEATLADCLQLDFRISFAGPVTFKNAERLRGLAARVPADRLVVETDSPYLTPHPYRGQRNEPSRVQLTAQCLAELRGEPYAQLAAQTTSNAAELFRLDLSHFLGVEKL
jgi:TatD DNase family protein